MIADSHLARFNSEGELSLEDPIRQQGKGPVTDFSALVGGWPEDETPTAFSRHSWSGASGLTVPGILGLHERLVVDPDVVSFLFNGHPAAEINASDLENPTLLISFMTLAGLER